MLNLSKGMMKRSVNILKNLQTEKGGFLASSEVSRYPYVYPRDMVFICKALDCVHAHKFTEDGYFFLKEVQTKDGEWLQRYDAMGVPRVSRAKETDCTGLVLHGIYDHYCNTKDMEFLEEMKECVRKGVEYIRKMNKGGLICGKHSVFENRVLEEGHEIWTNSWCWRGLCDSAHIAKQLGWKKESIKWAREADQLKEKILHFFWDKKRELFIKTIKPGTKVTSIDVSLLAPTWAGLLSYSDEKTKKTADLILKRLWDVELGGFLRFEKWKNVKDWHWYDGGHGPWVFWTLRMARTLKWAGYEEAANRSLKWGLRQFTQKGFLPEHISKFEEFLEWRENEPDVNSSIKAAIKEAQKNVRKWRWDKKENSIVHWVAPLSWSHAELILTLSKLEW